MNHLKNFSDFLFIKENEEESLETPAPQGDEKKEKKNKLWLLPQRGGNMPRETFFPLSPIFQEGEIPIYNSIKARKGMRPEAQVKKKNIAEALEILLTLQGEGVVDEIRITADVPSQGKSAPKYLVDELEAERKRLRDKILSRYGGRIEASDYPETACDTCSSTGSVKVWAKNEKGEMVKTDIDKECPDCKGTGIVREPPQKIDIFTDTEFLFTGIEKVNGVDCAIGIPVSKISKIKRDPALKSYYKTCIQPGQILEIEFDPY